MKISAFYPMYYANDIETALKHFTDDLGFNVLHHLDNPALHLYVLENNGYRVDIFTSSLDEVQQKEGFYSTRINVDDIEEAIDKYHSWGCRVSVPVRTFPKMKFATMEDENGVRIFLFQHIKK